MAQAIHIGRQGASDGQVDHASNPCGSAPPVGRQSTSPFFKLADEAAHVAQQHHTVEIRQAAAFA
jgi:hypothetical protein